MREDTITINGKTYITHDCLVFGHFLGCAYTKANIETLKREYPDFQHYPYGLFCNEDSYTDDEGTPPLAILTDAYNTESAHIREDLADKWLEALNSYPSLDDQLASSIENDLQREQWNNWQRDALLMELETNGELPPDIEKAADAIDRDTEWTLFYCALAADEIYYDEDPGGSFCLDHKEAAQVLARVLRQHQKATA